MPTRSTPSAIDLTLIACLIVGLAALGYVLMGPLPALIFSVFLIGGLIPWYFTSYGRPVNPDTIVVPYLLTVIFFIIHVAEEFFTDFWTEIGDLGGRDVSLDQFLLVAAFIGPVLWLSGLILLYMRTEIGNYLTWAFLVAMTVSELSHFVFPFVSAGRFTYFSGLYTAALPLIPAAICIYRIVRLSRGYPRASAPVAASESSANR